MPRNNADFNHGSGKQLTPDEIELIEANKHIPEKHDKYPKTQKKVIAFEDLQAGATWCTSCAKHQDKSYIDPKLNPFIRPHYNTEHDAKAGSLITCSAGCGKTIVGQKKYYA
jgi:hypothetical protein